MDYKLTLHCLVGKWEDDYGQVTVNLAANITDEQAVRQVAAAVQIPGSSQGLPIVSLDPSLSDPATRKPRAAVFQGTARAFFDTVCVSHHLDGWIDWNGLNIRNLSTPGETPNLVYAPPFSPTSGGTASTEGLTKYTLIGSPEQTEQGISFRVLLDPALTLGTLVKLDFTLLNKLRRQAGQLLPRVDQDGIYVTRGIRHLGDTRGNAWYSEVIAVVRGWSKIYGTVLR